MEVVSVSIRGKMHVIVNRVLLFTGSKPSLSPPCPDLAYYEGEPPTQVPCPR
jgi:hypothetical protein